METTTWTFEYLEDLISDFYKGKLLEHPNDNSDWDVCRDLNNIYWLLPTPVVYTTEVDKQVYIINNYQWVKHISNTLIDNNFKVKFNPKTCLCEYVNGVLVEVIYFNNKLFELLKTNNFTQLEIDNLREFHHRLHYCKIAVYKINHTRLNKYKKFNYEQ